METKTKPSNPGLEIRNIQKSIAGIASKTGVNEGERAELFHEQYRNILALPENTRGRNRAIKLIEERLIFQFEALKHKLAQSEKRKAPMLDFAVIDDFKSQAAIGILRGIRTWDPTGKSALSTWVFTHARKEVQKSVAEEKPFTSLSDEGAYKKVVEAKKLLDTKLGRTATNKEIAEEANVSVKAIDRIFDTTVRIVPLSIDAARNPGDRTGRGVADQFLKDVISEDLNNLQDEIEDIDPRKLQKLSTRDMWLTIRYFGLDGAPHDTLNVLTTYLGCSPESARNKVKKALDELKKEGV